MGRTVVEELALIQEKIPPAGLTARITWRPATVKSAEGHGALSAHAEQSDEKVGFFTGK